MGGMEKELGHGQFLDLRFLKIVFIHVCGSKSNSLVDIRQKLTELN
jgi:hypothetical protein